MCVFGRTGDPFWCLMQAIVWRAIHWFGLGVVLWQQGRNQLWTQHFTSRGRSLYEAFENWKRLYNLSWSMNLVVFVGAAVRHFSWVVDDVYTYVPPTSVVSLVCMLLNWCRDWLCLCSCVCHLLLRLVLAFSVVLFWMMQLHLLGLCFGWIGIAGPQLLVLLVVV